MSKQRLVLSLILVNGKRELLGVEDVEIPTSYVPMLEKAGQKFTTHALITLLAGCKSDGRESPKHD
jgi:hypothetical protein